MANNEHLNNNTYLLYKNKNWKGINIDLDQKNIDLFNLVRKRDINIKAAISSGNFRKKIYFYHSKSAINTIEKKISNFQKAKVKNNRCSNSYIESIIGSK